MIHGPKKTEELARKALAIREETGAIWPDIAKQLGVSISWLRTHTLKFGRVVQEHRGPAPALATPENIRKAQRLRAQRVSWKLIARELGFDSWQWLRRQVLAAPLDEDAELERARAAWQRDVPFADFWVGWLARARQ